MATTIVTKNGTGAPTASDLVAGELAVDLTNGRLYTTDLDSGGTVIEIGLNPSGNVDVTGTVTADGLTVNSSGIDVNGDASLQKAGGTTLTLENSTSGPYAGNGTELSGSITFKNNDTSGDGDHISAKIESYITTAVGQGNLEFHTGRSDGGDLTKAISIEYNGDISFYEDTGTTAKFFWDASAESLGIGTSSPSNKLDIKGTVGFEATNSTNKWLAYTYTDNTLRINYNGAGADEVVLASSGNVGIGTSDPQKTLDVKGTFAISNSTTSYWDFDRDDSDGALKIADTGTERMRIDSSGNVGIGVSAGERLTVAATNPTDGLLASLRNIGTSGLTGTKLWFNQNTIDNWNIGQPAGVNAFVFCNSTGSTNERMRIDASGNVGIGNTSPTTALDVSGAVTVTRSDVPNDHSTISNEGGQFAISAATGGGGGTYPMLFKTAATERMRIDSSGNLLVGTTSSAGKFTLVSNQYNAMSVQVNADGNVGASWKNGAGSEVGYIQVNTSSTLYSTSSDQRLKDNIVDAPSASDDIDAIQVRSFDWKADGSHQKYGMIAQELVTVAPEAVSAPEDPDEMMGVDYSKLVPMLVKEIQSLRARVAQLES